jgi:hypothetical protein
MRFNVDVYLEDTWVRTYYDIEADDEAEARQMVEETMQLDLVVEDTDE